MKYIIWGAGRRGKWAIQFLDKKNVLAFIDSNPERIGDKFCGKTIISFEEAQKKYDDYLIVLTPLEESEKIAQYLENKAFYCFLKLDDLPMNIPCDERDEFSVRLSYDPTLEYGYAELNLLSIWLYQKMTEANTIVRVVFSKILQPDLEKLLHKYIKFSSWEDVVNKSDMIIGVCDDVRRHGLEKFVTEESFAIEHMLPIREELLKYKNIHQGKRCFIVATGPSLKATDLDKLHANGDICISMNRIFNIFDRTEWRPDYYVVGDTEMIEDMSDDIANLNLPNKFVASEPKCFWKTLPENDCIAYKLLMRGFVNKEPFFSSSIEHGMGHGTTVTYICIQLAAFMGFSEIYLLGVDCNYSQNIYDKNNHFEGCDTDANKIRLNAVYPERMMLAYAEAKKYCDNHGVRIYNATRGGKLEVYERVLFDNLF